MRTFNRDQKDLLALLGKALFDAPCELSENIDWDGVMCEALQQTVFPLAFEAAKGLIPGPVAERLSGTLDEIMVNNLLVDHEHIELHQIMTGAGIPYVVMKGSASASYYPVPILRTMGDVDFLVSEHDVARAGDELEKNGFLAKETKENTIHRPYIRENESLHRSDWELHWRPNGIPNSEAGNKLLTMLQDSVETARTYVSEAGPFRIPDNFHHGLMILIHAVRHMIHSGIGLRHLCDWAAFVSNFTDNEFRSLFEEALRELGLWTIASALTAVCVRYLGLPDPGWEEHFSDGLMNDLICDVLDGGNFGRKDRQRINASVLYVDRRKGTLGEKGKVRNLTEAIDEKAMRRFPSIREHPFLLPAGRLFIGARHLVRVATKKSPPIHLGKMIDNANERSALYQMLKLYEGGNDE